MKVTMKKSTRNKIIIGICFIGVFILGWTIAKVQTPASEDIKNKLHITNPSYEYLVSSGIYQLSAESDALIMQGYAAVQKNVSDMLQRCADEEQPDWILKQNSSGENEMYHNGKRVAIISDIDDTLVNGVNYTADILGNNGDWNNAAFARFLMSDECTALPGAVECLNFCRNSGIEVYYVTNRYDQGYKVGQSDSQGSYDEYVKKNEKGTYVSKDGEIIGTSIYQLYGKSMYDISLESMRKLGFPVDDQHLIVNDNKLKGSSKEPARQAIIKGCENYNNGQRENENTLNTAMTLSCDEHDVAMFLGDQLTDFTDEFDKEGIDAVQRRRLSADRQTQFGSQWIVFPNAVYGRAMDAGIAFEAQKLFRYYAYINPFRK